MEVARISLGTLKAKPPHDKGRLAGVTDADTVLW